MKKLLYTIALITTLTSCTKDEVECAKISLIDVEEVVIGRGFFKIKRKYIRFTYDNGNTYRVGKAGEDYSHLSDLDECELLELRSE